MFRSSNPVFKAFTGCSDKHWNEVTPSVLSLSHAASSCVTQYWMYPWNPSRISHTKNYWSFDCQNSKQLSSCLLAPSEIAYIFRNVSKFLFAKRIVYVFGISKERCKCKVWQKNASEIVQIFSWRCALSSMIFLGGNY